MDKELKQLHEREEERHRVNELEQTVARLLQRMDTLKQDRNHLRARTAPQLFNSGSNNHISRNSQAGHLEADQGEEAEPMDTEDNAQSQAGIQDVPVNNSAN
jgi:hypothetical protein